MKAPFPWFGGKSRAAPLIWQRLGDVTNYVEPFAGSLAVMLGRPASHAQRVETVNDLDCDIANMWRATKHAPAEVAAWADDPVNEADLHARHLWLVQNKAEHREKMMTDPHYFDAKRAGWWVWGLCQWIGSGWCAERDSRHRKLPRVGGSRPDGASSSGTSYGVGVHGLAVRLPRKKPILVGGNAKGSPQYGKGVHARRFRVSRQIPAVAGSTDDRGAYVNHGKGIFSSESRTRLVELFQSLKDRLRFTRVVCGDWRRVVTPAVTWRHGLTGVVLDPPYADGEVEYSAGDVDLKEVRRWALDLGARPDMRIALCGYEGTLEMPPTWDQVEWTAKGGYGLQRKDGENDNHRRERIWFSPACIKVSTFKQPGLFGEE